MAFWSSQRIKAEQKWAETKTLPRMHPFDHERIKRGPYESPIISDFNEQRVKHGAYELSLSKKFLITPNDSAVSFSPPNRDALKIPPGQFALLYTKESVNIPKDVIAFISLKGSVKFRGLINISGFQVDPGFPGYLKFSVYNASGEDVHLNFDAPCFLIWFADLDKENEPYTGEHKDQNGFTTEDRDRMSDPRHSTENIHKRLLEMEKKVSSIQAVGLILIFPLLIGFVVAIFDHWFSEKADPLGNGAVILNTVLIAGVFLCCSICYLAG
jgi:dCTP deaminase